MRRRPNKITNPMTPIGPVPFVGRQSELADLKQDLALVSLVSLHGSLGSGKSRLVAELAPTLGAPVSIVECHPGDRASALRARAERALRCVPGTLAQTLTTQARVLVIDDIQHLRIDEATSLLAPLLQLHPPGEPLVVLEPEQARCMLVDVSTEARRLWDVLVRHGDTFPPESHPALLERIARAGHQRSAGRAREIRDAERIRLIPAGSSPRRGTCRRRPAPARPVLHRSAAVRSAG